MRKPASKTTRPASPKQRNRAAEPSLRYEDWLVERLKDPAEAAAYMEAVIEEGDQAAIMLALRQVARAQGGIAEIARRAKLTREATYRMLSKGGNPELKSLTAILDAAGLRLSVIPVGRRMRKLLPRYTRLVRSGKLGRGTESTRIVSEDRNGR